MISNVLNGILKEYEILRNTAEQDLNNKKEHIYSIIPRIKEIDSSLSMLGIAFSKSILNSPQKSEELTEELHQKVRDLKAEKVELLVANNFTQDYLTLKYTCPVCKDTGFVDSQKCKCLKQKLINYAYDKSNLSNLLSEQNFDTFDFEYYSNTPLDKVGIPPRKNMQDIYKTCLSFVNNFDAINDNLLFTGPTGLGKTFLSSCIAKDLLDKGKTVFYQTAFKTFDILEEYKFSKDKDSFNKEKVNMLFDCDLLIIDDLGTEFINSYTSSEFFNILNSRLLDKKKTIISTNLSLEELFEVYSARVVSRLIGHYKVLKFFGEDIRKKI